MKQLYTLKLSNLKTFIYLAISNKVLKFNFYTHRIFFLKLLFLLLGLTQTLVTQAQRTFTICPGEKVVLTDFLQPSTSIDPGAPGPGLPTRPTCYYSIESTILPTDGLIESDRNSFTVAPLSTTSYIISSRANIGPPPPGESLDHLDHCPTGQLTTDKFTIIVEECEPITNPISNSETINYETEYYLCYGDTLIEPPVGIGTPGGPKGLGLTSISEASIYRLISVTPNINWEQRNSRLRFFPNVTTEYILEYGSSFGFQDFISKRLEKITIVVGCSAKNNIIIKDFPWLAGITSRDECDFSSIEVYEKNNANYIYINGVDDKLLYYQDGSFLCRDNPNYSCVEAYQLTNLVKNWSCNQATDNTSDKEIFSSYSWLSNLVDQYNCNDEVVTVYDAGSYKFVLIQNSLGERLYDTSGKFYCFSSTGFGFLNGYDESSILEQWACNGQLSGRKVSPKTESSSLQIFPNPAKEKVFINLQELAFQQAVISIYDVQGKRVNQNSSDDAFAGIVQMDVRDLDKGIYLVEVQTSDSIETKKLLIQ